MSDRVAFGEAVEELSLAHEAHTSLCDPFLRVLPVDGVSISTLGAPFGTETVCATDELSARLDELQFDLGVGPCWDALATRHPVLVTDIRGEEGAKWPTLFEAIGAADVRAVYAFPLLVGSLTIGAVSLYSRTKQRLDDAKRLDTLLLANIAARQVLRSVLAEQTLKSNGDEDEGFSRRIVHQATGMVLAQLNLSAADALLILHGHAFSEGRTVREVATKVVARELDLSSPYKL